MIFIIADRQNDAWVLLVKAKDEKEIMERLRIEETETIVGRITDDELSALSTSKFCVITA